MNGLVGLTIDRATDVDATDLAGLRRAWEDESHEPIDDGGAFEREFAEWFVAESGRRDFWLARLEGEPVGMLNLAEFRRMPRPGRPATRWGYIGNVYVVPALRNRGIGARLVEAAKMEARRRGYVRLVLSPSPRSLPMYRRAGFDASDQLLVNELAGPEGYANG